MGIHYFTLRKADLTIVTNQHLALLVQEAGGRPVVLPDKIPSFEPPAPSRKRDHFQIFVITSFGKDEPIQEILEAARRLENHPQKFRFTLSGNWRKFSLLVVQSKPESVHLTGFIPEKEFVLQLYDCDIAMTLTTAEACLLCGCYEAIAAEKPLITSNTSALRQYFDEAYFVDNTPQQIVQAVLEIVCDQPKYRARTISMKGRLSRSWKDQSDILEKAISSQLSTAVGLRAK